MKLRNHQRTLPLLLVAIALLVGGCASNAGRNDRDTAAQWHGCDHLTPKGNWSVRHMQDSKRGTYYVERWNCQDRLAQVR